MHDALKYFYHRLFPTAAQWHPILAFYYLTYSCSFRCPYCSDGKGKPYYTLRERLPDFETTVRLVGDIRKHVHHLVLTGGEPLEHPEYAKVIREIPSLKFKSVALTTNGYLLDRFCDETVQCVTDLIVSLDTLIPEKADSWLGKENGCFHIIMDNLLNAAKHPKRKCRIHISSVVTPHNIADSYSVYDFAKEHGFHFAACPQLVGVSAHQALVKNEAYKAFYDYLIAEKKKGYRIFGSPKYLASMRDFSKFYCRPFTMLVVSPEGNVFYPCLEKGKSAGNLLESGSLAQLKSEGFARHGAELGSFGADCPNQCHSACALGFATILDNPFSMVQDAMLGVLGDARHRFRLT